MSNETPVLPAPSTSLGEKLNNWGSTSPSPFSSLRRQLTSSPTAHCMPPAIHAILIAALHGRPTQPLPLLFAPALLFSSYVSLAGFPTDSAGMTCAWSGLYTLLALRRKQRIVSKFSPRGIVRAGAMTLGLANSVAGGYAYTMGDRKRDEAERMARQRWQ